MWISLCHLAVKSWYAMVAATNTGTLGFSVWTLCLTFALWLAGVFDKWYLGRKSNPGWRGLILSIKSSIRIGLIEIGTILMVAFIAWAVFLYRTVYFDHINAAAENKNLRDSVAPLNQRIKDLKESLNAACYLPDRHLSRGQHDVLYKSLKELAIKYHNPRLDIGYFEGDQESMRFAVSLSILFKDAGFIVPSLIHVPPRQSSTDPPDPGSREGLSIQIEPRKDPKPGEPSALPTERNHLASEIEEALWSIQVKNGPYQIPPEPMRVKPSELILWVGFKNVEWNPNEYR
jgi:hypothetical protein